jgi:hypothetical protein
MADRSTALGKPLAARLGAQHTLLSGVILSAT